MNHMCCFAEKVEALCKDLGVVYLFCFPQDVVKLNKQYLHNIACEINAKVYLLPLPPLHLFDEFIFYLITIQSAHA